MAVHSAVGLIYLPRSGPTFGPLRPIAFYSPALQHGLAIRPEYLDIERGAAGEIFNRMNKQSPHFVDGKLPPRLIADLRRSILGGKAIPCRHSRCPARASRDQISTPRGPLAGHARPAFVPRKIRQQRRVWFADYTRRFRSRGRSAHCEYAPIDVYVA